MSFFVNEGFSIDSLLWVVVVMLCKDWCTIFFLYGAFLQFRVWFMGLDFCTLVQQSCEGKYPTLPVGAFVSLVT